MSLWLVPDWYANLVTVIFGLIVGSFLNVVIARLPHRKSIIKPGSHCPRCQTALRWLDNIPVLSWLLLMGRCRSCRNPISVRYVVVELLTALLFLAVRLRFGWDWLILIRDWPFIAILIAVTFIDLEHRLIPDTLSLGGLALGLLTSPWVPGLGLVSSGLGAALGFGIFYGIAWVYQKRTGHSGLGGGDVKFLAMLGSFLGPMGVMTTIFVSSVAGSVVGILWGVLSRQREQDGQFTSILKVSIPYGPFLVIGGLYGYLLGDLWLRFTTPI